MYIKLIERYVDPVFVKSKLHFFLHREVNVPIVRALAPYADNQLNRAFAVRADKDIRLGVGEDLFNRGDCAF